MYMFLLNSIQNVPIFYFTIDILDKYNTTGQRDAPFVLPHHFVKGSFLSGRYDNRKQMLQETF